MSEFATRIVAWQREHGRHDLPWQNTRDPYVIWLSEIMLQQTQVATVIPYFKRFLARFPDIESLAAADENEVLRLWSGLGYYSRGRNLHHAATLIMARHSGRFPESRPDIEALPGIGRSTAAAIAGFAFGARAAILDGNVKRVLARHFVIEGHPGERDVEQVLWGLAESLLPLKDGENYIQGLMDLGATVCTSRSPRCEACPIAGSCRALEQNRVQELPTPKTKKQVPTRDTIMLVLMHGDEVLLQKRPAIGIWGGLWSFPEYSELNEGLILAQRLFGCEVAATENLSPLKHSFTHFHLRIAPVLARVERRAPRAAQPGVVWSQVSEALNDALPTPAKKILRALQPSTATNQTALFEEALQDFQS